MNRRAIIALLGGAAAWPLTARAQKSVVVKRIGVLVPGSSQTHSGYINSFRKGLAALGYVENRDFTVDIAMAEGRLERLPSLASELLSRGASVLVTGSTQATAAARQATTVIPIVQAGGDDLVRTGAVKSLAHPGGNVTGLNNEAGESSEPGPGKLLEMLVSMVPPLQRVGYLNNPTRPAWWQVSAAQEAARALRLEMQSISASDSTALELALQNSRPIIEALVVSTDPVFVASSRRIVEFGAESKLPVIYPYRVFVDQGGLMSYGVSLSDNYRRAAKFVDQIFKGTPPAEIPVEQPTKFELVINLKTAKALGLEAPSTLLVRADEVIE
jgi:putative ABC transport system substrate-binding protein